MSSEPQNTVAMPRYQCHKVVHALKIASVQRNPKPGDYDGCALITPADEGYAPFEVDAAYVKKHDPRPGGYYVLYENGYKSFSPAQAFEGGYTRME